MRDTVRRRRAVLCAFALTVSVLLAAYGCLYAEYVNRRVLLGSAAVTDAAAVPAAAVAYVRTAETVLPPRAAALLRFLHAEYDLLAALFKQ